MNADADEPAAATGSSVTAASATRISEAAASDNEAAKTGAAEARVLDTGVLDTVTPDEPAGGPEFARLRTRYWDLLFGMHLVAAAGWWWLMPGGFPVSHPRFWVNSGLPWLVVAVAVAGIRALKKRNVRQTAALTTLVAVFWSTVVVAGCVVFPATARHQAVAALLVLLVAGGARLGLSPVRLRGWRTQVAAGVPAFALGLFVVFSQRGPAPATHPSDLRIADFVFDTNIDRSIDAFQRGSRVQVSPGEAAAVFSAGRATIEVKPLLQFESRSPDRCWTLLAAEAERRSPPLREVGRRWEEKIARVRYYSPPQTFSVDTSDGDTCLLEAVTQLDQPVYSHLNSLTEVTLRGHGELTLTFSPCDDITIPVYPSDYPVGRPIRFAFLGADGIFRVVEATSAEKGPFKTLAEGALARDEPLTIGVRVDGRRAATITFLDFASQASTELSPTAGWGVPQNAIEMRKMGSVSSSPVRLWLTLAGTSVGRGFDSVGHAAGTYRNRVRIQIDKEDE